MQDFRDQQLDNFLEDGERSNVISLFDGVDEVEELEPEELKKPGKWHKTSTKGLEVYVVDDKPRFNNV